ncbi:MAG: VIT1/CCC1 transporter family protein [Actinobacteria bacterium]|nr:VIT1/CCC1 transporter family protein [Actinomycetota bacterium]
MARPSKTNAQADGQIARYRALWADEMAGAALYRMLAEHADERRRAVFLRLADAEARHASHWAALLEGEGVVDLTPPSLPFRVRFLGFVARRFGVDSVIPMVLRAEAADADKYRSVPEAPESMALSERAHGRALSAMRSGGQPGEQIVRSEGRHRTGVGGALRASVFGVQDGLISNLLLVMGIAGATDDGNFVIVAGVLGLLSGAFSMAAGEWNSVRSQRELYEREIEIEAEELKAFPEEEREELSLIYQAKGIPEPEADSLATQIMAQPATALDTLVREELGLDPGSLGSARVAAVSSFFSFAVGAFVPLLPFVVSSGGAALAGAAAFAAVALFSVGALTSVFTGRPAIGSGLRLLVIDGVFAAGTYGLGTLLGVSLD